MSAYLSQAELLSPAQWPLVESLFEQVFGQALPRDLTRWKYAPGRGLSIGVPAEPEGSAPRLAAHCGLVFRDLLVLGQPARAAQFTDLMVAPQDRGRLLRMGSPFAKAVAFALSQLGSANNPGNPDRVTYGFPSARAMRLAEHLNLVREIDQVHELVWSPLPGRLPERIADADPGAVGAIDRLWDHMRRDLVGALVGVRDSDHFLDRYLNHPTHRYRVHLVRCDGTTSPRAVFALRRVGDLFELSDWVAPLSGIGEMLLAARAVVASESGAAMTSWITRGYVDRLGIDVASSMPTQFRIICRGDLPPHLWEIHRNRWWLTPGDTDYR